MKPIVVECRLVKLSNILKALVEYEDQIGDISSFLSNADPQVLNIDITSVVNSDSKVTPGALFIAIEGIKSDAHDYISNARKKGAVFVIGTKSSENKPDLIVKDSRAALGSAISTLLSNPSEDISVYGITGTNGKTTTTYLLSSIFKFLNEKYCVIGTTGIFLGDNKRDSSQTTPDSTLLQNLFKELKDSKVNNVAMEVSSHALDQKRVLGTRFKSVAFTNLTQDHLDYHKDFETYFNAKALLFDGKYSKNAVINIDNPYGLKMLEIAQKNSMNVLTTSIVDREANIFVSCVHSDLSGSALRVVYSKDNNLIDDELFDTKLIGDFNHENIATTIGLALSGDYGLKEIVQALAQCNNVPGRFERIKNHNGDFEVFVDYSHTPDALKRAIEVLKPLANQVIVIFGCGGDRDASKRQIMGKLASELADMVIVTNDNPRSEDPRDIIDDIFKGIASENQSRVIAMTDRYKAIEYGISKAAKGDCVLIAGKGHETYQEFKDGKQDFSDIKVAEEILSRK